MKTNKKGTIKLKTDSKLDRLFSDIIDEIYNIGYASDAEKQFDKWLDTVADIWHCDDFEFSVQNGMYLAERASNLSTKTVYKVSDRCDATEVFFVKERSEVEKILNDFLNKISQDQNKQKDKLKSQISILQNQLKHLETTN